MGKADLGDGASVEFTGDALVIEQGKTRVSLDLEQCAALSCYLYGQMDAMIEELSATLATFGDMVNGIDEA